MFCDTHLVGVEDGVGGVGVAIAWLPDAARIDHDTLSEDRVVLEVGVSQQEDFLLVEETGSKLLGEGVAVWIVRVAVDDFDAPVECQSFVGEAAEPLGVSFAEFLAGVVYACARLTVEREPVAAGDGPVVVAHHRRHALLTNPVDTLGRPGVVADNVTGTQQRVDGGHIIEHCIECDLVPVDI